MNAVRHFFYQAFFWTYERGTWPWDLHCLVIILIIFSTPKDFLMSYSHRALSPDQIATILKSFLVSFFR